MAELQHYDYRDFKFGDLVRLNVLFGADKKCSTLGVVTGFTNVGWIKITWSNSVEGAWPFYKIILVQNIRGKQNDL